MESTISYGYPYGSARIQTGTNCSENKSTPTYDDQTGFGDWFRAPLILCDLYLSTK